MPINKVMWVLFTTNYSQFEDLFRINLGRAEHWCSIRPLWNVFASSLVKVRLPLHPFIVECLFRQEEDSFTIHMAQVWDSIWFGNAWWSFVLDIGMLVSRSTASTFDELKQLPIKAEPQWGVCPCTLSQSSVNLVCCRHQATCHRCQDCGKVQDP